MQSKGHEILYTCREKEFEIYLLKHYGFDYKSFGNKYNSIIGKTWGIFKFGVKEFITGRHFKPDILLSHGSIYAAHAAFLLNKPHISLEDTFNPEQCQLYLPFTKAILTADYDHPLKSEKVIKYAGYHELAYLHPKNFTVDKSVMHDIDTNEKEKYVLFRFVSWNASHDRGHNGITYKNKIKAITHFEKYAKVYISSEQSLPKDLKKYEYSLAPERMHDFIAGASLVFSESATMVSEAAMLGVPSIYVDSTSRYYTKDLENRYGLCFNYSESQVDQGKAIEKGIELLKEDNILYKWKTKNKIMLRDKIDVTSFMVWFVENWPKSYRIIKENSNYQFRFR